MRILAAGGGSGGHVTPVLAILEEISKQDKKLEVVFICDKKFAPQAQTLLKNSSLNIELKMVQAGKLRRYHGVGWWHVFDPRTLFPNIRDAFLIGIGVIQSYMIIKKFRPDVAFTKGGFVCLPVGYAAYKAKIPLVIHDSDAHPGLTNRILAKWAVKIATGAPLENYKYPKSKSVYTGIPVSNSFAAIVEDQRVELKKELTGFSMPLVVVTGGGLGAKKINKAVLRESSKLVEAGVQIVHITGKANFQQIKDAVKDDRYYKILPFVDPRTMSEYLKAADVVVTRAGATTAAELASLKKATIFIPNPLLTGGHQVKNALAFGDAAIVLDETILEQNPNTLAEEIRKVVFNPSIRKKLEAEIAKFAKPNSAKQLAKMIISVADSRVGE